MKKINILISYLFLMCVVLVGITTNLNAQENIEVSKETEAEIQKNRAAGIFDIPDDNLQKYVVDYVNGMNSSSWTVDNMPESELTALDDITLDASDGVKSLEGLDYYIANGSMDSLRYFSLETTEIQDISPILGAETLYDIEIYQGNVPNLDMFSNKSFPILEQFSIIDSGLNSIEGLSSADMPLLSEVNFDDNNLTSLKGLENKTTITRLEARNNQISDISALTNMTDLYDVRLTDNQIVDASSLANKDLYLIDLSNNHIEDFSWISTSDKGNLFELFIDGNAIHDYTFLAPYIGDLFGPSGRINIKLGDEKIVIDLGYLEELSTVPTTLDIILPDGTVNTVDLGIDVSTITDFGDYSFDTSYSFIFDDPSPSGFPSIDFNGTITVKFSYVAPIPLTPLDPSIPVTTPPVKPVDPTDPVNPSEPSIPVDSDKEDVKVEREVEGKKLIQTGKTDIVTILSILLIGLIAIKIRIQNKRV